MTDKDDSIITQEANREAIRSVIRSSSKQRIYSFTSKQLIQYNALIFHKGCKSLSSNERKMVQDRVKYGIEKGFINPSHVADEINKITNFLRDSLIEKIKDGSSTD